MRKKIIIYVLAMLPLFAMGQKKFEPQLKVSYELGVDKYKNKSFGGELMAGYRISRDFRLGVGLGIYWCKHLYEEAHYNSTIKYFIKEYRETASYIPLFANGKYNFETTSDWRPYLSIDLGYAIFNSYSNYAKDNSLGLFVKPALGIDYMIGKGALFVELGYKFQGREFQSVQMGYSQLTMSIGYQF